MKFSNFFSKSNKSKKFSLALGGWAARWLAHIGIIKYLEENNLYPSEISGTSMWSIIASLYVFGKNSEEMLDICRRVNFLKLIDFDFKKWVIKWNKIKAFFDEIFGDFKIEDSPIPLKIISTDIKTWEKYVFTSWSITEAIRSSISIPGIIMPNIIDQKELIDGWIVNNLPIDELNWNNVIAVSVLRDITRPIKTKINILWIEFNQNFLGLSYQILQKTIDVMMKQNEDRSLSLNKKIIHIHPKFVWIDYYEFNKFMEIVNIWYKQAQEMNLASKIREVF